jgi:hypothetical protein
MTDPNGKAFRTTRKHTKPNKKKPSGSDIRERRARVLGARVAVAETRARRTDSGDAVTDIAEPSWRVVLDSGEERGAGVDATFGVRGPGESRRSSSSALDVFFGLDSDARVDVDPRTLAIVAALARAYGAPSPRASDVDEAEDPGCSGFRAREEEEEENTEDTAREPEGLAEAFGEVLSASRASVASRASSDASDDGSRSRSRESDDDSDDDAFFDAESHELPSVSGELASLAGDEKARARKKTSKNATVAFAAPSLALRARWADADDEADADDDDCVVAAVRGVRASFAASRDGGFSVDASLESLDVREETSVGSTSESDRAAEALASLPFPFAKKTRNAAETKSFRQRRIKTKPKTPAERGRWRRRRTARGSRLWRAATRERAPLLSRRWAKVSSCVWTPRSSGDSPRWFARRARDARELAARRFLRRTRTRTRTRHPRAFARVTRRREKVWVEVVLGASRWTRRARVSPWSRGATAACRAPRWTRRASPRRRRRARRRTISRRRRTRRSTAPTLTST